MTVPVPVTEVNSDAEPDAPLLRRLGLALDHPPLDLDRAAHGVHHARELCQEPIAGVLNDATPVLRDLRLDQLSEVRLEPLVRSLLIRAHQSRVARDIDGEDCSKATDRGHVSPRDRLGLTKSTPKPAAALVSRWVGWTGLVRNSAASPAPRCRSDKGPCRTGAQMRIAVIGIGGIGGPYGTSLAGAGADVTFGIGAEQGLLGQGAGAAAGSPRAGADARGLHPHRSLAVGPGHWIEAPSPDTVERLKASRMQIVTKAYPHNWTYSISPMRRLPTSACARRPITR
jgi:hypothetical protein